MSDVTVVMAARNEERHIGRALRSLNQQTEPCEIIVVDDGSDDHTALIAESMGATVLRRVHTTLPAALNEGLRTSQSRYVVRVDADDYVAAEFVQILSLFLDYNPTMQAVACDYLTVDEHENHLGRFDASLAPIACGIAFRRDRLVELGLYDESFPMAEEVDLFRRFTAKWPIHHVALPLYRYRRHSGSLTLHSADEYARWSEVAAS